MSEFLLSALAVVCPSCDSHNPPRATRCASCHQGMASTVVPGAKPAAKAKAPEPSTPSRPPEATPPGLRPAAKPLPPSQPAAPTSRPPETETAAAPLGGAPASTVPPGRDVPSPPAEPALSARHPAVLSASSSEEAPAPSLRPPLAEIPTAPSRPSRPPLAEAPLAPSLSAPAVLPPLAAAPMLRPPLAEAPLAPSQPAPSPTAPPAGVAAAPVSSALPLGQPPVPKAEVAPPTGGVSPRAVASVPSGPPVLSPVPLALQPTPPAPAARPPLATSKFGITVVAGASRGQRFRLPATGCVIGRSRGAILFPDDSFLSPLHATLLIKDGGLWVRDESSASGVFVSIVGVESLAAHALFSVGMRLFRFTGPLQAVPPPPGLPLPYGAPLPAGQVLNGIEELWVGGRGGRAVVTAGPALTIGQGSCDLAYPHDEGLAVRHCELSFGAGSATLKDLSGGLGTYVRIPPLFERPLRPGDRVRMGQHLIQIEAL